MTQFNDESSSIVDKQWDDIAESRQTDNINYLISNNMQIPSTEKIEFESLMMSL